MPPCFQLPLPYLFESRLVEGAEHRSELFSGREV